MDKIKQWVALTVVGVLAVLAAGWFLLVSPKRTEAADARALADQERSAASVLQTQLSTLKAQAKALPQQQAKLAAVAAKIPDNPALPALIRALSKAADDAGVELTVLAPGQPALVVQTGVGAPSSAAPVAPAAGQQATPGVVRSGTSSPTGAASSVGTAAAGTLMSIPVDVSVVGGFYQIERFFDQVENLSRAMKVTKFNLGQGTNPVKVAAAGAAAAPQNDGRTLLGTITANVYMAAGRLITVPNAVAGK